MLPAVKSKNTFNRKTHIHIDKGVLYFMAKKESYTLGIDIGSTTVKIAILDEQNDVVFPTMSVISPIYRKRCPTFWDGRLINLEPSMPRRSLPAPAGCLCLNI